jgi:two-component system invasion response regulator UvrY
MLSILIIDDHLVVRRGLTQILQEELRGVTFSEAATATEALLLVQKRRWHLIILDISLPGKDGLQLLQEIRQTRADARVLILSMHAEHQYATRSLQFGASGYICKDEPRAKLVMAIRNVLAGKKYFPKPLSCTLGATSALPVPAGHNELSARECNVLRMLAAGRRPSDIATELKLSIKTVSTYKVRILNKMHWTSTVDMVHYVDQTLIARPPTQVEHVEGRSKSMD